MRKYGTSCLIGIFIALTFVLNIYSQTETGRKSVPQQDSSSIQEPVVKGFIKGRILEYETLKPLAGVSVIVLDSDFKTQSDESGYYELSDVPVGYYTLSFQRQDYYTGTRNNVIIRPNRITFLNMELLVVRTIKEEVSVTAAHFPSAVNKTGSQMQFTSEDLRTNAGAIGVDVSRALYNVPGVAKADEEANDLIVRGGSPTENGFYIDNIFVPNINHFPQWGASGGNVSMLNMDFIDRLDVYTGGFEALYGNRLSSIIDIGYREGNRERINSQFNLSMYGIGAQIEGPLPKKKGSWMLSAHRSYLDLLRNILGGSSFPSFSDVQGKVTFEPDDSNRLSFLGIYGFSQTKEDPQAELEGGSYTYDREKYNVPTAGLNWRHLWGNKGYSDTSVSLSWMIGREDDWVIESNELIAFGEYRQRWITIRNVNQLQLSLSHQLKFGFELQNVGFRTKDDFDLEGKKFNGSFGAGYLTYVVYPISDLSLSSGIRLDYFPFSERIHLSPRFSFSWGITRRLSLNGAYGMFYQQMPLFLIKQNPGNAALKDPRARHFVLGLKYLLSRDTQLTLEAYDKQYADFPMSQLNPWYFVIDNVNGDEERFYNWGGLMDIGKAYARGVELTLQKKLSKKLYGILNLTYFRARYRDLMGAWRNRLFDNRFIICAYGGFKPNKNWEFNVRWTWSGNRAFTPVNEEQSILYRYPYVEVKDIMSGYLNDYQNLSLRVDRRFFFRKSNLVLFIGALNILDRENELYRYWDSNINAYESEAMWGMVPYIGLEFEF